jgi:hypothetical protein
MENRIWRTASGKAYQDCADGEIIFLCRFSSVLS